jgi:trans-2,3-dihydro-3-hydroxyanthranilate isomerase
MVTMATYTFYQLDVFTDVPLGGNPLAVFPDGTGLDTPTMQALAREMNLSETTFVFPSANATKKVRIFTPGAEVPLAGHPTIGTWWLLGELGEIELPENGTTRIMQETGAGILPVDIHSSDGVPDKVVMVQTLPEFTACIEDTVRLASCLGADQGAVLPDPKSQVVNTAIPQLMVPFRSLKDLQVLPSGGSGADLTQLVREVGSECAMCYSMETVDPESTVHCRMFAPGIGVPEDPATGSAAGALGSYLVRYGIVKAERGVAKVVVEQGLEIARPSRIEVEVSVSDTDEITEVRVGGKALTIIKGEVSI